MPFFKQSLGLKSRRAGRPQERKTKPFDEIFIFSLGWRLRRLRTKVCAQGFMAHTKRRYGVVLFLEEFEDMGKFCARGRSNGGFPRSSRWLCSKTFWSAQAFHASV